MLNARECVGTHDILFITIDSLRYDVAQHAWEAGHTPNLQKLLSDNGWELRHSPGNFTYAAHHAFFGGFFPTPDSPGPHPRLFALEFPGSETTTEDTCVLSTSNIIEGLAAMDYHTICVGGVGFFNQQSSLGFSFSTMFHESHWDETFGVTNRDSTQYQIDCILERIAKLPTNQRVFQFLNISATHQPSCIYQEGATEDSCETQAAALAYVDSQLPELFNTMKKRAPVLTIICSDHGTAFGEDGFRGHRLSHPVVWNVPYLECVMPMTGGTHE